MATNVSLPTCGVSTPVTAQVGTPETITVGSSPPKPKSRARLLFNTDGSVKLLGDPSLFPGSGIDSNSHNLVPTLGPDGNMTMLLTPLGPEGKTFILNPTNGCSLPKNFPLLNPVAKSTDAATAPAVTNSSASSVVVVRNSPQRNPVVVKTNEFKRSSQQKSLLAGFTKLTVPVNSPRFVTQMRIDPSGLCTSTVKVPVNKEDEKDHSRSSTLKAIADKINPDNANQLKKSLLSSILGDTVEKKISVESKPMSAMKCTIAPNGKIVKESKSNWSNLSSVSPHTPNIVLHRNNSQKTAVPKSVYPPRILPPPVQNVRWPGPNQLPAATKDKPMTYILLPQTTSDSARTGQPSLISASNLVSSIPNTSTVSSAQQIRLSEKSQITTGPPRYLYKTLSTDGDSKFVVYPTKPVRVTDKNPQVISGIVQGDAKTKSQSVNNKHEATEVPHPSTDDSKTLVNQGNEKEISLDPSTGLLATASEEEDSLCIKIDSVFSLSTKNVTEDPPAVDIKEEPTDPESGAESVKVKPESAQSEPKTVTCNPVYVVLDRLSEHQIAHYKTSIVKCSDYCRKRTLNFLCNLGLVDCEPTVHEIHPKEDTVEKDNTKSLLESPEGDVKQSNKRKLENENSDQGSKITKKDSVSEENAKTVSNVSEQSENKTAPQTEGSPPCLNVRKVESPGSAKSKVLKFTKLDQEQLIPKPPIVIFDSMQAKQQTNVMNSPAKTSPVNIQASKVMTGLPPVQLGVHSSVPITKLQDNTKKQYFLFNVNGQNILVPTSNDMQKPKAFMLKGNDSKQVTPSRNLPPALGKVSILNRTAPPKVATVPNTNNSNQKRPLEVTLSHENPKKVLKPEPQKKEEVIQGIRIKPEPITHGYGDEEPVKPKSKNSKVKVKKEPTDNGWQEIWSSPSTPLPDPTRVPKTKPKALKTSSKETQEKPSKGCEESPRSPDMPDLPMMRVPSSEEIAKSSATHNDRIERLKALLKSKEKLIEDLKEKRLKEGNILDNELFADSGPPVSQVKNHWDSNTGQTLTDGTIPSATAEERPEFDKIGSSDTESCEPSWSSFDVNDDIN